MATIGFIGLGHMGHPMVKNLLVQDHKVQVYDLVVDLVDALVKEGAVAASSPAEATQGADIVFTMLQTGEQVSASCLGDNGIFAHLSKEAIYIDSSSIAISTSYDLHRQAKELGLAMLDAPVSGGVKGAEAAALTIMVGGDRAAFERAELVLQQLGKIIIHAGAAGSGQAAKICNNMILGISMIAISEGFTLAEKLGLDPKKFFEISSHASGECWAMTHYCPVPGVLDDVPANHDYRPGFTAKMMLKDLNLSQDAAKHVELQTPLGEKTTDLYKQFVNADQGECDFSAIIKQISD